MTPSRPLLVLPVGLLLAACIGGKSPPSQFYMLEPIAAAARAEGKPRQLALAPVRIPQYVDRAQMVAATGPNAYSVDETHRWAERLDDNIARVLAQNLALLVPAERVPTNATGRLKPAEWRVAVSILEFHVDAQAQARVAAQWSLAHGEEEALARAFSCRSPAAAGDYHAMAAALNACLDKLSRELAEALRGLPD